MWLFTLGVYEKEHPLQHSHHSNPQQVIWCQWTRLIGSSPSKQCWSVQLRNLRCSRSFPIDQHPGTLWGICCLEDHCWVDTQHYALGDTDDIGVELVLTLFWVSIREKVLLSNLASEGNSSKEQIYVTGSGQLQKANLYHHLRRHSGKLAHLILPACMLNFTLVTSARRHMERTPLLEWFCRS